MCACVWGGLCFLISSANTLDFLPVGDIKAWAGGMWGFRLLLKHLWWWENAHFQLWWASGVCDDWWAAPFDVFKQLTSVFCCLCCPLLNERRHRGSNWIEWCRNEQQKLVIGLVNDAIIKLPLQCIFFSWRFVWMRQRLYVEKYPRLSLSVKSLLLWPGQSSLEKLLWC